MPVRPPRFQLPKFDWVEPTVGFLSPTFTEFLLFIATLILFIASWRDLRRALVMTFGDHAARLRTLRILNEIEGHLGGYLLTVTMINFGVGIATGIICAVTGMPNPAGLGALAATLNFFPIIGPVAMFVILAVVGVVTASTIGVGLIAALLFVGVTFIEGHFVTPTIIGRRLELNALAVFMALAFWTWLWGPMGGFLSSPLLIVALVLKEHLMPVEFAAIAAGLKPDRFQLRNLREPGAFRPRQLQELLMSSTDGETGMRNLTDKATYERLEKDVSAVKNDIAALTDQITDVLNSFAGTARKQARRGYKQARANADSAVDDMSERGSGRDGCRAGRRLFDRGIAGRRDHAAPAGHRRARARPRLPDRRGLAPVRRAGRLVTSIVTPSYHLRKRGGAIKRRRFLAYTVLL